MAFKSEVRDSTVNALLEKARERNYRQYLSKLTLKKVRGFTDEPISFDFPVTAIIGPNGGGKTTALGAAAIIYRAIPPRAFFAKSGKYDTGMQDWSIEYEIIDRDINARNSVQRTASFKSLKWNRDALNRQTLLFGVSRTVPASERKELVSCTSRKFSVPESRVVPFAQGINDAVSRILGKDVSGFKQIQVHANGDVTLLTGQTADGVGYSEFHFGAGESSIIRMVAAIESASDSALVLIEEIENGLHPVATIRLVEYLIWAAERKKIQVIFTTHSNEALRPLPSKAVWSATKDKLFQGKLDVASLRAITGQIETESVIFVEDEFAKTWVEAILRQSDRSIIDHFQIHAMSGDGTAVSMNRYHNENPAVRVPSVCVIDGDSRQTEFHEEGVYRLPEERPKHMCLMIALTIGLRSAASFRLLCFSAMRIAIPYLKSVKRLGGQTKIPIFCSPKWENGLALCRSERSRQLSQHYGRKQIRTLCKELLEMFLWELMHPRKLRNSAEVQRKPDAMPSYKRN